MDSLFWQLPIQTKPIFVTETLHNMRADHLWRGQQFVLSHTGLIWIPQCTACQGRRACGWRLYCTLGQDETGFSLWQVVNWGIGLTTPLHNYQNCLLKGRCKELSNSSEWFLGISHTLLTQIFSVIWHTLHAFNNTYSTEDTTLYTLCTMGATFKKKKKQ